MSAKSNSELENEWFSRQASLVREGVERIAGLQSALREVASLRADLSRLEAAGLERETQLAQQQATIDTLRRALEERSKQWHDHFGDPWEGHSYGADHLSDWGECQSEPCLSDRQALAQAAGETTGGALND